MDLIQAISSGGLGKTVVEAPAFDTPAEKGIFEVRELTIEGRLAVRRASIVATGETDDKGDDLYRYDDSRYRAALVVEATYRADGRKVFTAPDAIDLLLRLPGKYEPAFTALFVAAQNLMFMAPDAETVALGNSAATPTSGTS